MNVYVYENARCDSGRADARESTPHPGTRRMDCIAAGEAANERARVSQLSRMLNVSIPPAVNWWTCGTELAL